MQLTRRLALAGAALAAAGRLIAPVRAVAALAAPLVLRGADALDAGGWAIREPAPNERVAVPIILEVPFL